MLGLVAVGLEVEIMLDGVVFVPRRENQLHVELAPSFLLDLERRFLERWKPLA